MDTLPGRVEGNACAIGLSTYHHDLTANILAAYILGPGVNLPGSCQILVVHALC